METIEEEKEMKSIEYDKENLIEKVDDSWITEQDRLKLLSYLKDLISIQYPWADKALEQCLILKKYYNIIKAMDRKQYELDTTNPVKSVLTLLD
jgi:hypothetical protein|tara:strand:- start:266 stop:547 length:282 start_codon:yes stop_codon:yes gene_type:complete